MSRHAYVFTPVLSGSLIAFIDAFALFGQAQFLLATYERMRQPMITDLAAAAEGIPGKEARDIALVAVTVTADDSIYIDDLPDAIRLEDLSDLLAPLREMPGTAFLHGDPTADWGTILAVQRSMTAALDRQIVAPLLR